MNTDTSSESLSYFLMIKNENSDSLSNQAEWAIPEGWMALKPKSQILRKKDKNICQNIYQDCHKQD